MERVFSDLAIIIALASVTAIIFKLLKQPAVLAYILAGLIIGPLGLIKIHDKSSIESLSEIGITLLLFLLGLEVKIADLKAIGKTAIIAGLSQVFVTSSIGFILGVALGFSLTASVYLGIAISFSSTIVIVKLLSDKKDLHSLYGKITVGILLIQDFVAIFALIIFSGLGKNEQNITSSIKSISQVVVIAILLFIVISYLSQKVFPKLIHRISDSPEVLFISSIAWAFGVAILINSKYVGLSIEIGGFLAGLALANSVESYQIVSKVRSLRDFFVTIFFVNLGMQLKLDHIEETLFPALILSLFVIIIKPIIVMVILKEMNYKKRINFMTGISLSQVSEFSLILAFLGLKLGQVEGKLISVLTIVCLISFTTSSYLIYHLEILYKKIEKHLRIFDVDRRHERVAFAQEDKLRDHIVVVGAHRMGMTILDHLESKKDHIVVIDFNPNAVDKLRTRGFRVVFGDLIDNEILEEANIFEARLVISTVPNIEDNLILIHTLKSHNKNIEIFVTADQPEYIEKLHDAGATHVLQPYALVGKSIGKLVNRKRKLFTHIGEKASLDD